MHSLHTPNGSFISVRGARNRTQSTHNLYRNPTTMQNDQNMMKGRCRDGLFNRTIRFSIPSPLLTVHHATLYPFRSPSRPKPNIEQALHRSRNTRFNRLPSENGMYNCRLRFSSGKLNITVNIINLLLFLLHSGFRRYNTFSDGLAKLGV